MHTVKYAYSARKPLNMHTVRMVWQDLEDAQQCVSVCCNVLQCGAVCCSVSSRYRHASYIHACHIDTHHIYTRATYLEDTHAS